MKYVKWKSIIITCVICLLPIIFGVGLWEKLPESIAVHFDIYGQPDNFASKWFVVFIIPAIMAMLQIICCVINDINLRKHSMGGKIETVTKWIIPIATLALQMAIFAYSLGWAIDMRKVAMFITGVIFIVTGNYLPKLNYIKNYKVEPEKARKINRVMGYAMFFMGILGLACIFLPAVFSVIWIILLILFTIFSIIYGISVSGKK